MKNNSNKILVVQTARAGSESVKNKNIAFVTETEMLFSLPLFKLKNKKMDVCVSTDCEKIKKEIKDENWITTIDRPEQLCTNTASHHDVMIHAVKHMEKLNEKKYDYVVIILGNSLGTGSDIVLESIEKIKKQSYTGGMSVSSFNMFNPYRAFKIDNNELETFYEVPENTNDKNCMGDVYFFNGSFFICKRDVLLSKKGKNPFPWLGNKILPVIENDKKMEVDDYWQLSHVRKMHLDRRWKEYITAEDKRKIENIELTSTQWSGYKNVTFNIGIWLSLKNKLNNAMPAVPILKNKKISDLKILDFGTGPGWSHIVFKENNIVGLDIDLPKQNLEFAKFHEITGFAPKTWNGKEMPFDDDTFDVVIAKASITKLRNSSYRDVLNELVRVTKKGSLWLIGPEYMIPRVDWECIINKEKHTSNFLVAFDWNRNDHRNNVFQPMYAGD